MKVIILGLCIVMDLEHPFAHELERLDDQIDRLEAQLNETTPDDSRQVGERLELGQLRDHQALLTELINSDGEPGDLLEHCRRRLRSAERAHALTYTNGRAHDLRHADEWWETEDQIDYLADLIRQLEAALRHTAPP